MSESQVFPNLGLRQKQILEICREKLLTVSRPEEPYLAFMFGCIITDGEDQFAKFQNELSREMCYYGKAGAVSYFKCFTVAPLRDGHLLNTSPFQNRPEK
jgi:hypothetical protein